MTAREENGARTIFMRKKTHMHHLLMRLVLKAFCTVGFVSLSYSRCGQQQAHPECEERRMRLECIQLT